MDIASAIVKLDPARPEWWIHRSYSLHELKRTQEAYGLLLPAVDKFPEIWLIPYNLACYTAQLGQMKECEQWLKIAMKLDENAVKRVAIGDPDLQPLWDSQSGSTWKRTGWIQWCQPPCPPPCHPLCQPQPNENVTGGHQV